jgi:F-type H+-transporting ATPase subunit b
MNINATLFAQAITFFAFIWFCAKFVWPPLTRAIDARQKQIADGLAAAEQGERTLELSTRQADEELVKARGRAADIIAQAEKRVAQMVEDAKAAAREESGREKAAAKAEIEQEVSRARETLRSQVATLAIAGAEQILRREVDAKTHADLLRALQTQL